MVDVGQYRNEIDDLSELDIQVYERIFKVFKQSKDDKDFYTYNTLKKIDFPVLDSEFVDFYTVPAKTAMTIVAYKLYEDIKTWWILYLLNKDKFDGAPFFVEGGVQLKFIKPKLLGLIYSDITKATILGGRHF